MKTEGALTTVVYVSKANTRMTVKDLIKKYTSYGHDVPPSRLIHIDPGHFDPNNIMSYITIMVGSYFLANVVPSFTPIFIYMAIVRALVLAAQILEVRKKMKKIEGPFLGPHLGGARNMNQKRYVIDKDLLTSSKNMKIHAERLQNVSREVHEYN
jgi:hypothetical protein